MELVIKRTTLPPQQKSQKIEDRLTDTDLGRLLVFIKIDPETGEEKRSDAITNAVDKDKNKEPGYFVKWNYEYDLERRS